MNAAEVIKNAERWLDRRPVDVLDIGYARNTVAVLIALAEEQAATLARVREAVNRHPAPCADTEWTCGWKSAVADVHDALNRQEP